MSDRLLDSTSAIINKVGIQRDDPTGWVRVGCVTTLSNHLMMCVHVEGIEGM